MVKDVILLQDIYNDRTLNIFSDASSAPGSSKGLFCYGSIVVCKDNILDSFYTFHDNCSCSYDAELLGLRASLYAALNYKRRFYDKIDHINIFCDNIAALHAIASYPESCKCKFINGTYVTVNSSNKVSACEPILNECNYVLQELYAIDYGYNLELWHQNGHLLDNSISVIKHKKPQYIENFIYNNYLNEETLDIDPDFIYYISKYNCIVDETTKLYMKDYLLRANHEFLKVTSVPIKFKHPDTPKDYYLSKEEEK